MDYFVKKLSRLTISSMRTFLWVVLGVESIGLLYFLALNLNRYRLSAFELRSDFAHKADAKSRMFKKINRYLREITTLQVIDISALLLMISGFFVYLEQSLLGIVYAAVLTGTLWLLARISFIQNLAAHIFEGHYESVCSIAQQFKGVLRFIQPAGSSEATPKSKAELVDIIQTLPSTTLLPVERQRLELVLSANEKNVKAIMTPKKRVITIEPSATLGPVVLSDLQKSGHGYFPVATKKGEPEGILTLSDVIDLELAKQHSTIRDLMTTHLTWVEEDTSLFELAQAILEEKQYVVLARDQEGNFSGLVTISDLMKHLVGITKSECT